MTPATACNGDGPFEAAPGLNGTLKRLRFRLWIQLWLQIKFRIIFELKLRYCRGTGTHRTVPIPRYRFRQLRICNIAKRRVPVPNREAGTVPYRYVDLKYRYLPTFYRGIVPVPIVQW